LGTIIGQRPTREATSSPPNAADAERATAPDASAASTAPVSDGTRRSPWRLAFVVGGALVVAFLLAQAVQERRPFALAGSAKDVRIALLHCVMAGVFPAALLVALDEARRAGDALRAPASLAPSRRTLALWALLGVAGSLFGPYLMEPNVAGPLAWWRPSAWSPETAWHRVLGPVAGVASTLLNVTLVVTTLRLARLAPPVGVDELLDPRPLAGYARPALRLATLAILELSLYAAFALEFGAALQVLWTATLSASLAALALLLPLGRVHARLSAVRRDELAWCDAELREARTALRTAGDARGRLADLAAYRALVHGASEWGVDVPAARRLALYLLLPLGSWVASSVVQHLLERYVFRR
jgi:hypothetical protein